MDWPGTASSRFAALLALASLVCVTLAAGPAPARAAAPLSIAVDGNHFVDGDGATVRLLGVNRPSMEYACIQGWGYASGDPATSGPDGQLGDADAAAIAAWHPTAVRLPLNEDCWLGDGGYPGSGTGLTVQGYRDAVTSYVAALHRQGLYVILDLHWTAPAGVAGDGQRELPDAQATAFWTSVASTFRDDPAVVFDAFNEPYSRAPYPVGWACWRDGGCPVTDAPDTDPTSSATYTAVGMQALVTAIRDAGAAQPILLGGLDYANDLSGWLTHEPVDPAGQLAASYHAYEGKDCASASCWSTTIASVAAHVPVVTGEFDQDGCPGSTSDGFDDRLMDWADGAGVSYLAWGWVQPDPGTECDLHLVSDWGGTPDDPNGTAVHGRLLALWTAAQGAPPPPGDPPGDTTTDPAPPATDPAPVATSPGAAIPSAAPVATKGASSAPPDEPGRPVPVTAARRSVRLHLASVHVRGRRLTLAGSVDAAFHGRVALLLALRGGHAGRARRTLRHALAAGANGRLRLTLTLPRGWRLVRVTATAGGDARWVKARVAATPTPVR